MMANIESKHIYWLKITAVVLLSLCSARLFLEEMYFSATLLLLGIILLAVSIYHDRKKVIERMEQMIGGIRHSDFSIRFTEARSNDELNRLMREMNEALEVFRSRTHDAMLDNAESEAWQKLIGVLTHEIMNSIAPIISLSETMNEREEPKENDPETYRLMRQSMEIIHRRSKGLLSFVENYRKLTRLPNPTIQPIPVRPLLASLQQLTAASGIGFSYSVYPEQLLLKADKEMVEQLLLNLLKNAQEASLGHEDAKIEVKAEKSGKRILLTVSDNGSGIAPEAAEKIFIPFYTTKKNGSGIGLSLCRQIMIRHHGKISVQSNEKGSRFVMEFPED